MSERVLTLWLVILASAGSTGCGDSRPTPHRACDGCAGMADGEPPAQPTLDASTAQDATAPVTDGGALNTPDASDASGAMSGAGLTWLTGPIRPTRYRIPNLPFAEPPCPQSTVENTGTVTFHEALLGQTHLSPMDSPFQTVSANRPLTVAVSASGSGNAPVFTATARLNGVELTICLNGATGLPVNERTHFATSVYRGTFPADWVAPGLELSIEGGGWSQTLRPDVKAENGLTLYLVHAQLFGTGEVENTPAARLRELLARLPVSYLDVGVNPLGVWQPTKLLIGPREDGHTPIGETTTHDALVIDANPHCSTEDRKNVACTLHSGYATMAAVLATMDTFREANGVSDSSTWFTHLGEPLGGGLAGGQRGSGDDTVLVMNHELGHAWGFPHWEASHTDYPYEGVRRDNGGFGDRWAYDQVRDLLLSPICDAVERQSPMQRAAVCIPEGSWFDPYSDYEAARLLRMTLGAEQELTGNVPYMGGSQSATTRSFRLPPEAGRARMAWNLDARGMTLERYVEATNAFEPFTSDAWNRIAQSEVPVTMFSGGVIVSGEWFFEPPVDYVGNVLASIDPTDPADYAYLYEHRASDFYWARDLVLRFSLDDGTTFTRLYGAEAVLRAPGDHVRFAFNLPAEIARHVEGLEVIRRPLGHYAEASQLLETDSAATYLDSSEVLATWHR